MKKEQENISIQYKNNIEDYYHNLCDRKNTCTTMNFMLNCKIEAFNDSILLNSDLFDRKKQLINEQMSFVQEKELEFYETIINNAPTEIYQLLSINEFEGKSKMGVFIALIVILILFIGIPVLSGVFGYSCA